MAITSNSTIDDINTELLTNVSYREDGSAAKCKAFITAVDAALAVRPSDQQDSDGRRCVFSHTALEKMGQAARNWLVANSTRANGGSGAKFSSLENFR